MKPIKRNRARNLATSILAVLATALVVIPVLVPADPAEATDAWLNAECHKNNRWGNPNNLYDELRIESATGSSTIRVPQSATTVDLKIIAAAMYCGNPIVKGKNVLAGVRAEKITTTKDSQIKLLPGTSTIRYPAFVKQGQVMKSAPITRTANIGTRSGPVTIKLQFITQVDTSVNTLPTPNATITLNLERYNDFLLKPIVDEVPPWTIGADTTIPIVNSVKNVGSESSTGTHIWKMWQKVFPPGSETPTEQMCAGGGCQSLGSATFSQVIPAGGSITPQDIKASIDPTWEPGTQVCYQTDLWWFGPHDHQQGWTFSNVACHVAATYTVAFDRNDDPGVEGNGSMPSVEVQLGESVNLPANTFTRTSGARLFKDNSDPTGVESELIPSAFLGWSLDPDSREAVIADQAPVGQLTILGGDTVTLYAVWDDAPQFTNKRFPNRFFTVDQAQQGAITEEELLRNVAATDRETKPLETKTASEVEATDDIGILLYDFEAQDFASMTEAGGTVSVTYQVKDEAGNLALLRVNVTVLDGSPQSIPREFIRSISTDYLGNPESAGGLNERSLWRLDPEYRAALNDALDEHQLDDVCYRLPASEVAALKRHVLERGLGNAGDDAALEHATQMIRDSKQTPGGCFD